MLTVNLFVLLHPSLATCHLKLFKTCTFPRYSALPVVALSMPPHRQQRQSDDNESIDSGEDDGFPNIGDMATDFERAVSTGSAISFSRRGEIIEIPSEADEHSTARKLAISAGYFQRAGSDSADVSTVARGRSNLSVVIVYGWARKLVRSRYFAHFMVVVVLLDAVLTASDIDARAAGVETPPAVLASSSVCLALYTVELLLQLAVRGDASSDILVRHEFLSMSKPFVQDLPLM